MCQCENWTFVSTPQWKWSIMRLRCILKVKTNTNVIIACLLMPYGTYSGNGYALAFYHSHDAKGEWWVVTKVHHLLLIHSTLSIMVTNDPIGRHVYNPERRKASCQQIQRTPVAPRKVSFHLPPTGSCLLHKFLIAVFISCLLVPNGTYSVEKCVSTFFSLWTYPIEYKVFDLSTNET